jgi:ubiquinone/menaquinone biosynthesis C-methylase UbiE
MKSGLFSPEIVLGELGIEPGMSVVDLGTGAGHFALAAAHLVIPGGQVYALDVQRELLARVQQQAESLNLDTLTTIWGDMERTGGTQLRDDSIDRAVIVNVLFQLENIEGVLAEIQRVLKPGGKLMVIGWSDTKGVIGPHPDHVIPEAQILMLTDAQRLRFIRNFPAGDHHYGFIVEK